MYCLRFGCIDWRHPHWRGGYYPEDLPSDWRLGYYANELDCVLLTEPQWRSLSPEELVEQIETLPNGFRFYLQSADGSGTGEIRELLAQHFGGFLAGVDGEYAGWRWYRPRTGIEPSLLAITGMQSEDLRVWRDHLRIIADRTPDDVALTLIIEGKALTPTDLQPVRQLAELMGLA